VTEWKVRSVLTKKPESTCTKSSKVEQPVKKIRRLFYDIETSYNIVKSWRVGYNQTIQPDDIIEERAIICMCYKWEDEDLVHVVSWDEGNDKCVVERFVQLVKEADELVGHNIDQYDTKFMVTRAIKHKIQLPPKYSSYDTLDKAKKHFMFNSNKLDYIAKYLGLGGKLDHEGMKMWDDIILRGDKKALEKMIAYCQRDVLLTEEVFNRLRLYTENTTHHGVSMGAPVFSCPNCSSTKVELEKSLVSKIGSIKRVMKCDKCKQQYTLSNTTYLNSLKNTKN
jgi:DNA polymerase elongation subunit (family B)